MSTETTRETVGTMIDAQTIRPEWMRNMEREQGRDAVVDVTRKVTPFGTFVVGVAVVG